MTDEALLIVGSQRSGTTLLNRILNSHTQIALLYQQSNFLRLDIADLRDLDAQAVVTEARKADSVYSDRFSDEVLGRVLRLLPEGPSAGSIYRTVVRSLTGDVDATYWGEKYAGRCIEALKFLDLTATGKIIHIIRDPRDVCASEKRRREAAKLSMGARQYLLMLQDWKVGLYIGDYLARIIPERYHRIHYEDLVSRPEETVSGICRFLGLPFAPSMLEAHGFQDDHGKPWEANSYFAAGVMKLSDFRGRWKDHLPRDEAMFVEWYCSKGMKALRYPAELLNLWGRFWSRRIFAEMAAQSEAVARTYLDSDGYRAYSPENAPEPIDLSKASPIYRRTLPAELDAEVVTKGGRSMVRACWRNVTGSTGKDWIAVYRYGESDRSYIAYRYTNGSRTAGEEGFESGEILVPLPPNLAPGSYELRLFGEVTFRKLAVATFTIPVKPSV